MARKVVLVSDLSGEELGDDYAQIRVTFTDKRRGTYTLEVSVAEAETLTAKGRKISRRRGALTAVA